MIIINEILKNISYIKFIGDEKAYIDKPVSFRPDNKEVNALMWVSNQNIEKLNLVTSGTIICSDRFSTFHKDCNYIIVDNPRLTFQAVLTKFYVQKEDAHISDTATIHPTAKIGNDVTIGHNVVIEKDCIIGNSVYIDHNSVLKHGTEIHDHVKVGANCTIGGVGFGYELNEEKKYVVIPHLGNVIIKNFVEIGNNTCIDRAVLGSTILEENVKVDNLVHIAHGVVIGKNSLIIANSMIAGSTKIGENVWVAPSASILNKKTVADNSYIGMGAVVIKDVKESETIVGNPGKVLVKSENKT